jgi:hypothetical protein
MQIKEASSFPVISRSGRTSAELQMIIDTLNLSKQSGKPYSIEGVQAGKKYNSMQQRIRAQARKVNVSVEIHYNKETETLYFRVPVSSEIETALVPDKVVKSKDIKSVKALVKNK